MPDKLTPAVLALADGSVFWGLAVGKRGITTGEVVFNTAMTGYQEIITDPSYTQQIIAFTSPHIGNVGVNADDIESTTVWAKGLIMRELPTAPSNWRAQQALTPWLQQQQVIGIAGIDTRALTHILREKGALAGCIMSVGPDADYAIAQARLAVDAVNADLTAMVSTAAVCAWEQPSPVLDILPSLTKTLNGALLANTPHIVVYDFGVKLSILRMLVDRECRVSVVPATTTLDELQALQPDGVVLSNGPGDPAACAAIITIVQAMIAARIPILGICLGHQLVALACGATTYKMPFGHHGANHPVVTLATNQVSITSQNHSFAVAETDLPPMLEITHRSLFDNTIQGLKHCTLPILTFQGHPEANPGPTEAAVMFDDFLAMVRNH